MRPTEADSGASPPPTREDLSLLGRCLALNPAAADTSHLRLALLAGAAPWERIFRAADMLRLTPAVIARLRERGLVPPAPPRLAGAPARVLDAAWTLHQERRARQAACLQSIVSLLNRHGVAPILLKGARALWTDAEPWRTIRDLDLLIPGAAAREAYDLLLRDGFAPLPGAPARPNRHHFDTLFRPDLPGWVEIHRRAGNPYAEQFLPTAEIEARGLDHPHANGRARILPDVDHLWHGLVHHHFGHSAFARGMVDLKGLFEFATGFCALTDAGRTGLVAMACRDSVGLAALDLWLAAAADLLAMPFAEGVVPRLDAMAAWRRMQASGGIPKHRGYRDTLKLAWAPDRLRRMPGKGGLIGARLTAIARLMPKIRRH